MICMFLPDFATSQKNELSKDPRVSKKKKDFSVSLPLSFLNRAKKILFFVLREMRKRREQNKGFFCQSFTFSSSSHYTKLSENIQFNFFHKSVNKFSGIVGRKWKMRFLRKV